MEKHPILLASAGRKSGLWRTAVLGLVFAGACALVADTALAGAARSRRGGSGGPAPQTASGRATYGYRGHHGGHYGHYGHYGYYGGYYRYGPVFPYYAWAAWPWGWWYTGRPYYVERGGSQPTMGVIETDIRPGKAEVRVDGEFVGQARDFNGRWNLLWLDPGDHLLEFTRSGYMSLRRRVKVRAGMHVQIVERLEKGEGIDPRSSAPAVEAAARDARVAPPAPVSASRKAPQDRGRLERGLLRLEVEPHDAAVYLDGEFLARADELSRMHGALPVARGVHTLEVVRPGYASRSLDVEIGADEPTRVQVILERED